MDFIDDIIGILILVIFVFCMTSRWMCIKLNTFMLYLCFEHLIMIIIIIFKETVTWDYL